MNKGRVGRQKGREIRRDSLKQPRRDQPMVKPVAGPRDVLEIEGPVVFHRVGRIDVRGLRRQGEMLGHATRDRDRSLILAGRGVRNREVSYAQDLAPSKRRLGDLLEINDETWPCLVGIWRWAAILAGPDEPVADDKA